MVGQSTMLSGPAPNCTPIVAFVSEVCMWTVTDSSASAHRRLNDTRSVAQVLHMSCNHDACMALTALGDGLEKEVERGVGTKVVAMKWRRHRLASADLIRRAVRDKRYRRDSSSDESLGCGGPWLQPHFVESFCLE